MSERTPVRAWLSLGSNISPRENIAAAIADLKRRFGRLVISPIYESKAVGFPGENFHNLVVGIETSVTVHALARALKAIEAQQGRVRCANKSSPRTLDIDLLTFGDHVIDDGVIQVPRGEILRYAFVLLPLSEVAGDERHPQTGQTYRALWQAFDDSSQPLWPIEDAG